MTTASPMMTGVDVADIRIEPDKAERGMKAILVGGVRWGTIHMQSAGANGAYYWFEQIGDGGEIIRSKGPRSWQKQPVKVWGDKTAKRIAGVPRNPIGEAAKAQAAAFPSIDERLMAEAKALIGEGLLRHPDVVKAEQERANAEYRERRQQEEQDEQSAFEAKAAECLAPLGDQIGDNVKAEVVAQIVAAMKWAQTK